MIITRTPFRITLGGGGTDLPSYYSRFGGFVLSASINKYMYINLNRPVADDLVRVKYSKSETVRHRDELSHDIAREAMRLVGMENGLEIASMADVPAGTGLGSSSSYAVGLLNALHTLKREHMPIKDLADEACMLEMEILKKPIGKQDQYMAAFGGINCLEIQTDGEVRVTKASLPYSTIDDLNRNLLMFYTNISRSADEILKDQSAGASEDRRGVIEGMHRIKEIGYRTLEAIQGNNLTDIGLLFDEHWTRKKQLSSRISNHGLDKTYEEAKKCGAIGGKITGAGGGGFFLFYVEERHNLFRRKMEGLGLKEMRYRFDFEGSKVLVNFLNGVI
jgi:D-glycero-alpha-D-manno-heptose-7-phosphate kinase